MNKQHRIDIVSLSAVFVLVVGTFNLIFGAWSAGVTLDEPTHVSRTQSWVSYGWYVPEHLMVGSEPDTDNPRASPYIYGPGFSSVAHLVNIAVGQEESTDLSYSREAHGVRHLVVAFLGLATAAAVGTSTWALTGSRRFALWGAAGLLAIPVWTGHSFFNVKDIPAAAGYTFVTTALLLALLEQDERAPAWRRKLAVGSLLVAGVYIGVGTRYAFWAAIAASIGLFVVLDLGRRRLGGSSPRKSKTITLGATLVGVGIVAFAYPNNARDPAEWLVRSITDSAGYSGGSVLTAGEWVADPWWYLPAWIFGSLPLLILVATLVGIAMVIKNMLRSSTQLTTLTAFWRRRDTPALIVLLQLLLVPVGSTVVGATMYDGLRQHLYVVPAMAILAAVGSCFLWRWARSRDKTWVSPAIMGLLSIGILLPTIEQTVLLPYNYAYVNPVAGIGGVNDRWETDYWFASAPEALSLIPLDVELRCTYDVIRTEQQDTRLSIHSCQREEYTPFMERRGTAVDADNSASRKEIWVMSWKRGGNKAPVGCETADQVTRWLRGEAVVMALIFRCDPQAVQ